ncbi:serine/threonine-protein kinase [Mycobacterium sp.]|uniref:serine/threonine-protein kinase n=1 Tax=Mycobacterium sp. TaxID=1785 RepID=UPI002CDC7D11|nr:serine/threonine-protein kinase [Mycobacterium sp.]HME50547.1 serine/threonine-protein kinase [Mycobacterium sp.]
MLRPGGTFEGYVIDGVLGRGGSATVYRAHDEALHPVALKVLDDEHRLPPELTRLQREFDFARQLDHPHVISVERHRDGWLTMQLVDGGNVGALDTLAQRLEALGQIADALDYVHYRGIIHCDVKPTNILVAKDFCRDGAVLIDFGVAHALAEDVHQKRPLEIRASLPYLAPELLRGQMPTGVTDEYALACTAVELVTGAPPFAANTSMAIANAQLYEPPPRISQTVAWVPRAFDSILQRAMAKDREERYQTCTEFVEIVTKVLAQYSR